MICRYVATIAIVFFPTWLVAQDFTVAGFDR
jgi:hypothetical protein